MVKKCVDCSWQGLRSCPAKAVCARFRSHKTDIVRLRSLHVEGNPSFLGWLDPLTFSQAFVVCIGAGPWKLKRRTAVQTHALFRLGDRDLKAVSESEPPWFPLRWQNHYLKNVVACLHRNNWEFNAHWKAIANCAERSSTDAEDYVEEFLTAAELPHTKVVSLFLRDKVGTAAFPIDRHVARFLKENKLPCDEKLLIRLCKDVGVDAAALNRWIIDNSAFSANPIFTQTRGNCDVKN